MIILGDGYPIMPEHINAHQHMFDAFGNHEKEVSAGWIVRFVQQRGTSWLPFSFDELNAYYHRNGRSDTFRFNGLETEGLLILDSARYYFTHRFVAACFWSSPAL